MPFIAVRDLQMYYETRGVGPRLLFISGTGGDLRRSPNAFESPLSTHFEVLVYDQRGLGRTDKPDVPYTMADYADDANALLDAVGWDRCMVMGVSFEGGHLSFMQDPRAYECMIAFLRGERDALRGQVQTG